jgi:15-cis-phytoene synthase
MRVSMPESARVAEVRACRALLRDGSRTFHAASYLLPRRVREPASALYAFCRLADDAVDGVAADAEALPRLRARLDAIYAGRPEPVAADRAFARVVTEFAIPRALPDALLEGFEWDLAGRSYDDLEALHDYAARVAGTVGAMMALVMGVRDPAALARACDLGVAMQLSNIARDVGEDARAGRLYLPRQWLRDAGVDPDGWTLCPEAAPAVAQVVRRLLQNAEWLYARAGGGITRLPRACRPGINAARALYAEIGREVARRGTSAVRLRTVVSPSRKVWLLLRAYVTAIVLQPGPVASPLRATRFLVEAVAAHPAPVGVQGTPAWWNLADRLVAALALFETLERRESARHAQQATPR